MRVLGIETSCDETAIAIYCSEKGLLAHEIFSQKTHIEYGGVVPELASRDHIRKIMPLINQVLSLAQISLSDLDGIAYTAGPGLIGALLVGAVVGHSLAFALAIPSVGIHHLEGHLLAVMLEERHPEFPFLALLVSGGHSQLIDVQGFGQYTILGESIDDAAGEAFDKTAKLLGLPYPGGPELAKLAQQGNPLSFKFPRPLIDRGLDFSFSGLKTAVANAYYKSDKSDQTKRDIAASFEHAVVDTLTIKSLRAMNQIGATRLVISGGVGANLKLRENLQRASDEKGFELFYPRSEFCTDNGAMIAYAGCMRLMKGEHADLKIKTRARWPLSELSLA